MFKQIVLPFLLVAAFIVGVGLFVKNSKSIKLPGLATPAPPVSTQKIIKVGSTEVKVEIANTSTLRARGLSGRTSLDEKSGMLFAFDTQNAVPVFWMKDMLIPIDIIWINDGKIVRIDTNVQPPESGTADRDLATYSAGQPVDQVLEVTGGFSDKNKLKAGDPVDLAGI